ncbi:transferrin binding protein-like solute binding protein [Actinobacillus ureae]|nr:transferrin binding protein-like solute binding protein [Actinobacillus ureae]SUU47803.1 transferrin binding protein-like solute binding protein [Actinobacillus ureae]
MKFKKSYIATLFSSLLLVACSNNKGDFGLENTQKNHINIPLKSQSRLNMAMTLHK